MGTFKIIIMCMVLGSSMRLEAQQAGNETGRNHGALFSGVIKGGELGKDSLNVRYVNNLIVDFRHSNEEFYVQPDEYGVFSFRLSPANGLGKVYLRLAGSHSTYLGPSGGYLSYYVENNDSIFLEITIHKERGVNHFFSGKGADKYVAIQNIFSVPFVRDDFPKHYYEDVEKSKVHIGKLIKRCELKINIMKNILDYFKERLSLNIYTLLEVDIIGKEYKNLIANISSYYYWNHRYELLNEVLFNHLKEAESPENILASSNHYIRYIIQKTILGFRIKNHCSDYNTSNIYNLLQAKPNDIFRDKLITRYLYSQQYRLLEHSNPTNIEQQSPEQAYEVIVRDAFQNQVQHLGLKEILASNYKRYMIGTNSYNFELPDIKSNLVKLSDFKGKVVLIDVYAPGCTGCVKFAKRLKETIIPEFEGNSEVEFVAISCFPEKEKWIHDLEESDRNASLEHQVCLWAGGSPNGKLFTEYYQIRLFPTLFLIDKAGKIYNSSNDGLTLSRSDEDIINMIYKALGENN
ncbi:peroxiredoxin family protein [Sinomicrobium oceani]|uniref:peroxiredoxin family protein n=1 Tax=Sinomicrobium oceani TaxID=1150368 RepID=UPI00227A15F5|nr:TlpA disulfide reductase family protein [Sinomicrobium oceani]